MTDAKCLTLIFDMREKLDLLFKPIEDKTIVWFAEKNEYNVLENTIAQLLKELNEGIAMNTIAAKLSEKMSIPEEACIDFYFRTWRVLF